MALSYMREEDKYKDVLRSMGEHPFFLHYLCNEQIHIYRNYCANVKNPKLIIDTTGLVVKNFTKFQLEKTKHIFLYEALAYDDDKKYGITVSNMLSERHNSTSIFCWLSEWLNCNVQPPKETVSDMSLALLSAITQCFTQYLSLKTYIQICGDIVIKGLPLQESNYIPRYVLTSFICIHTLRFRGERYSNLIKNIYSITLDLFFYFFFIKSQVKPCI